MRARGPASTSTPHKQWRNTLAYTLTDGAGWRLDGQEAQQLELVKLDLDGAFAHGLQVSAHLRGHARKGHEREWRQVCIPLRPRSASTRAAGAGGCIRAPCVSWRGVPAPGARLGTCLVEEGRRLLVARAQRPVVQRLVDGAAGPQPGRALGRQNRRRGGVQELHTHAAHDPPPKLRLRVQPHTRPPWPAHHQSTTRADSPPTGR